MHPSVICAQPILGWSRTLTPTRLPTACASQVNRKIPASLRAAPRSSGGAGTKLTRRARSAEHQQRRHQSFRSSRIIAAAEGATFGTPLSRWAGWTVLTVWYGLTGGRQSWDFGRFLKTVTYFNEPPTAEQVLQTLAEQPSKIVRQLTGQNEVI